MLRAIASKQPKNRQAKDTEPSRSQGINPNKKHIPKYAPGGKKDRTPDQGISPNPNPTQGIKHPAMIPGELCVASYRWHTTKQPASPQDQPAPPKISTPAKKYSKRSPRAKEVDYQTKTSKPLDSTKPHSPRPPSSPPLPNVPKRLRNDPNGLYPIPRLTIKLLHKVLSFLPFPRFRRSRTLMLMPHRHQFLLSFLLEGQPPVNELGGRPHVDVGNGDSNRA